MLNVIIFLNINENIHINFVAADCKYGRLKHHMMNQMAQLNE
jgi:hypothetical protein